MATAKGHYFFCARCKTSENLQSITSQLRAKMNVSHEYRFCLKCTSFLEGEIDPINNFCFSYKYRLVNEIDFDLDICSEQKMCCNCIFYQSWNNLTNDKDKKFVLNSLFAKQSNRLSMSDYEVVNFRRIAMLGIDLDFMHCTKCEKIFNFKTEKELRDNFRKSLQNGE